MLEEFCRPSIFDRCKEYVINPPLVQLKGKPLGEGKFTDFFIWSDKFTVYENGIAKKLIRQTKYSPLRLAVGLFSRNGAYLCDCMVNNEFFGNWEEAMRHYGTFNAMFEGFKKYYSMRKDLFMSETEELIREQTGKPPKIMKSPSSHGGVANLLKVLTKTMSEQGSSIRTIAKVQYAICTQAGIFVPEEFITDVLVATEMEPNASLNYDEYLAMEKKRLGQIEATKKK